MEPKQIHAKRWANSRKFKTIYCAQGPIDSNINQIYGICEREFSKNDQRYSHLIAFLNGIATFLLFFWVWCHQATHLSSSLHFVQQGPAWAYHGIFYDVWFCVCTAHVILMMIATKNPQSSYKKSIYNNIVSHQMIVSVVQTSSREISRETKRVSKRDGVV